MAAEKELIKGIQLMRSGKEEGFNILYSHTYNYVYGRAKMIMKNEEDALDLTQETFIQAYKNIHTLEDPNNIYAWLGSVVYNNGMKIYRKKRDLLINEEAETIFENVVSEDKDIRPEITAEEKATADIVMGMINELPDLQRSAILAFYYDNMKIDEIAEVFECSPNTIKSRLNYAKKYLKEKVEEHEKTYAYRLHTVSPAIIVVAFRSLLGSEAYTMPVTVAQTVYNTSCTAMGIAPAAIVTVEVTTGAVATGVTADVATKTGLSLGAKVAIGLATTVIAGALVIGGKGGEEPRKQLSQVTYYDADGNITMITYSDRDEEGKSLKSRDEDPDGNEVAVREYIYDEAGELLQMNTYRGGELTLETLYVEEEISRREYYSDGVNIQREEYTIEESGNVRINLYRITDGVEELNSYTIEEESEDGQRVVRTIYGKDGQMQYEHIYTYDEYGFVVRLEENAGENAIIMDRGEAVTHYVRDYVNEYDEEGNPLKVTTCDEFGNVLSWYECTYEEIK